MDVGFAFFLIVAEIMAEKDGEELAARLKERGLTGTKLIKYWVEECEQSVSVLRAKLAQPEKKERV